MNRREQALLQYLKNLEILEKDMQDHGWSCLDPDHNHATKAEADACTEVTDQQLRQGEKG